MKNIPSPFWLFNLIFNEIKNPPRFWVGPVEFERETQKAYLIKFDDKSFWYPKSQIFKQKNNKIKVNSLWNKKLRSL